MLCRLAAVKKAADAANRRLCFVGMSLNTYLEAAHNEGMAPFDPRELIAATDLDAHDPNEVMIVTTGSQVICQSEGAVFQHAAIFPVYPVLMLICMHMPFKR